MTVRSFELGAIDEVGRRVHVIASTRDPVKGIEPPKDANGTATERLEVLESWDLSRYPDNDHPVPILWQHDAWNGAIGFGKDVVETERGLEMWIEFAHANVEPKAEEAWKRVKAKLIRAVSVGFEFGERSDETRDGKPVAVFRKNTLLETSLVTIPADPGAAPAPPLKRADAREGEVRRFDSYKLGKARSTPTGGLRVPARLTRTGILEYRLGDGTIRRELRLPEEVFNKDSLDGLRGATVTDLAHHRGFVDPANWKDAALGTVLEVKHDEKYVEGELDINEAQAVADVGAGRLADISCGYACTLEHTPGTWNGERYDAIQRGIRYNHVAVLPPGRGRAGTDVGIRLDAADAESVGDHQEETKTMKIIKLDGKDVEYGSETHIAWLENKTKDLVAAEQAKTAEQAKRADAAEARADVAEKAAKKTAEEAKEEADKAKAEEKAARKKRLQLTRAAMEFMDEEDDEEKKSDALDDLSDRDLMIRVVRADDKDFDDKGRSDDYVQARYDMALGRLRDGKKNGVDSVVAAAEKAKRSDAREGAGDTETKARQKMFANADNAWKNPTGAGAS